VPDEALFCPHCDIPIPNASSQPTVYTPPPGSDPRIGGRFPPGMLLGGRYRMAQWSRMTLLHRSHEIVALSS
jgi:hypothetical protein